MVQSASIEARMQEAERLVSSRDEALFPYLADLLAEAVRSENRALEGYVHYQYASAYFDLEDGENLLLSLQKALELLLVANDREWISRACNLFGVYAKQHGCIDMCYNYYLLAYSYVEEMPESLSRAIVEGNLGDLYAESGDFRKAGLFSRKSLKTFRKLPETQQVRMYCIFETLNLALYQLGSHDLSGAKKTIRRAEKMMGSKAGEAIGMEFFWHLLVLVQYALAEGNSKKVSELMDTVVAEIVEKSGFILFAREIQNLGSALIAARELEAAGRLIAEADKTDGSASTIAMRLTIARLQADYYHATGDREAFVRTHRGIHGMLKELERTKRELSFRSARLLMMHESIRLERNRIRDENERLKEQARTDALTELPNRFALNEYMDIAFEKALRDQTVFGFGIVDIDAFKQYNDNFGHAAGDACLKEVAATLREIAGQYGFFVSRYGGDEFTMIYENMDHAKIKKIEKEIYARIPVPVSHGYYADIPDEASRQWDYMTTADMLMYKRKRGL